MKILEKKLVGIFKELETQGLEFLQDKDTKDLYLVKETEVIKHIKFNEFMEECIEVLG